VQRGVALRAAGTHFARALVAPQLTYCGMQALCVQLLLAMDRPDVAERTVKAMVAVDDDATLTQLAGAWCNLGLGGGVKVQEAAYAFQELGDKYVWTPKLYCGAAVCHMHQGQWDEAEKDLMEVRRGWTSGLSPPLTPTLARR